MLFRSQRGRTEELFRFDSADKLKKVPDLKSIEHFADCFGIPTRKAIKALAGDYAAEIKRLHDEGRTRAARWNRCLAWGMQFGILLYVALSMHCSAIL